MPLQLGTVKADGRGLLAVVAVSVEAGTIEPEVNAGGAATTVEAVRSSLATIAWTDSDIGRYLRLRARMLDWRWDVADAELVAERVVEGGRRGDCRVMCVECRHYQPGRCWNHRRAGLQAPSLGRDLAVIPQQCPGFRPK